VAEHVHTALSDRTDRVLGVLRRADLAYDRHIEWRGERTGHLCGDGYAAPRKADDYGLLGAVGREHRRKPAAGVLAV
jgi:hypothetical protein